MNRYSIGLAAIISLLIATDLIIHKTDGDSLIVPLSQIDKISFLTISETTSQTGVIHKTDGDSLTIPLSQIDKITFSNVNDTPPTADTILVYPGDDINSIVDNNPEGTTFIIKSGIHRMQEIWPKNGNTFLGETGAIINGGRVLTEFEQDGGLYYAPNQTQEGWYPSSDICLEGWERCNRPEDLFFDNEPLRHVTSLEDVATGKWFFDYDADRIYFSDNPEGHVIETSITNMAIHNSGADVTIKNLLIEKYAVAIPAGAVGCCDPPPVNWLLENNEIRLNHGAGVVVGSQSIVINNYIHHNGHLGIAAVGNDILLEANEISHNVYTGVDCGWECGGGKFSLTDKLSVVGNYVHHNNGTGIWTDTDNTNVLYEGNWVWWNARQGIQHEISQNVVIKNNDVRYNGNGNVWLWGSQILIQNSRDAEIYDNTIIIHGSEFPGNGIGIIHQDRDAYLAEDNYIHHNEITYLGLYGGSGIVDDSGDADYDSDGEFDWACGSEANNLFDYNSYHHNGIDDKFQLCETYSLTLEQFQAEGQEIHGTMDSNVIIPDDTPPQVCPICPGL